MSENQDFDQVIKGHDYDGIEEFDNPLPGWWLVTFLGAIIFAFGYLYYYEMSSGPSQVVLLEESMQVLKSLKKSGPAMDEEKLAALATSDKLALGKTVFTGKCAACHGQNAEGLIGPNLTDKHAIHGTSARMDIFGIVVDGVLDKGMPPWKDALTPDELVNVVNYVHSLKGTFVANGKPVQGNEFQ